MRRFFQDKRNIVILLLAILFIIRALQGEVKFIFWMGAGLLLCGLSDLLINKFFLKRIIFPKSAIVTGCIISGILDYRQPWIVLIIFSLSGIISKHFVKYKQRHIFNPANFALFFATLFKVPLTWNIESNSFLIIAFGIYLVYAYKKFPHIAGFLVFFLFLSHVFKINSLGLISWFFVFIMLIEPKTSGYGFLPGFIFGGIAGISSFVIFRFAPNHGPYILSLFIANLSRVLLEKIRR